MEQKVIDLFESNYNNKGMCENLQAYLKKIEKEFKKSGLKKVINYLPWAVVERIFRLQGGKIEIIDWKYVINFKTKDLNVDTGVIEENEKDAMFIHLKGTWQGEELDEFYPIFDNQTSKVIKSPDAQQLNASRQRGSVRLIARLSGIGLWVFEQTEGQFEEDDDDNGKIKVIVKEENNQKTQNVEPTKKEKAPIKKEIDEAMTKILVSDNEEQSPNNEEDEQNIANMFLGSMTKKPENVELKTPVVKEQQEDFTNGSEEHADLLLKVKSYVKTKKDIIMAFRNGKGKELLSDLTYSELKDLLSKLE